MKPILDVDCAMGGFSRESLLLNPFRAQDKLNTTVDVALQINIPMLMNEAPSLMGYCNADGDWLYFSPIDVLRNK